MDDGVVVLEDLEAALQPPLGGDEDREILVVLDLVMAVEVRQEHVEARREPGAEMGRRHPPLAEFAGRGVELAGEAAEAVVDVEPELRHRADLVARRPGRAREAVEEEPQLVRPAGAGFEVEGRGIGHASDMARRGAFVRQAPSGNRPLRALDRQVVGPELGVLQHVGGLAVEDDLTHVEDDGTIGQFERGDGVLLDDDGGDAGAP